MNERQRERLLERIHKPGGTVGGSIPETVTVEGESIPLRDFYFEVSDLDELRADERERVQEVLRSLRRERLRLVQRIQHDEVDYEGGNALIPQILELERAINAFESLEEPGLEEQLRRQKLNSARELVELMRSFGKL